ESDLRRLDAARSKPRVSLRAPERAIDDQQVRLEVLRLSDEVALGVEGAGVAVENQLVVPADLVAVEQRDAVALRDVAHELDAEGVLVEHVRRCRAVYEQLRARGGEVVDGVGVV